MRARMVPTANKSNDGTSIAEMNEPATNQAIKRMVSKPLKMKNYGRRMASFSGSEIVVNLRSSSSVRLVIPKRLRSLRPMLGAT